MFAFGNPVDLAKLGPAVQVAGERVQLRLRSGGNHFHIAVIKVAHHPGDAKFFGALARKFPIAYALNVAPYNVMSSHAAAFIVL